MSSSQQISNQQKIDKFYLVPAAELNRLARYSGEQIDRSKLAMADAQKERILNEDRDERSAFERQVELATVQHEIDQGKKKLGDFLPPPPPPPPPNTPETTKHAAQERATSPISSESRLKKYLLSHPYFQLNDDRSFKIKGKKILKSNLDVALHAFAAPAGAASRFVGQAAICRLLAREAEGSIDLKDFTTRADLIKQIEQERKKARAPPRLQSIAEEIGEPEEERTPPPQPTKRARPAEFIQYEDFKGEPVEEQMENTISPPASPNDTIDISD